MKSKNKNKNVGIGLIFLLTLFNASTSFSQDTLWEKNKSVRIVKILEVNEISVKFRRFDQIDGPVYYLQKTEIQKIHYADGTKDNFGNSEDLSPNQVSTPIKDINKQSREGANYITEEPSKPKKSEYDRSYDRVGFMCQYSSTSPFGFAFAKLKEKGSGLYLSANFNIRNPDRISIYEMNSGVIDDNYWRYEYAGVSQVRNNSINIGLATALGTRFIYVYSALGLGWSTTYHSYYQYGPSTGTYYGIEWIKDNDNSEIGVASAVGMIVSLGGFNLNCGISQLNFKEIKLTGGIGFSKLIN